jgi:protein-L-isoaspartate(D-aspartate) O-methyltransferase
MVENLRKRGITDEQVLAAMDQIERDRFVPADRQDRAYADLALQIGHDQTISSPHIVALMTELVRPSPQKRALDIGTGSGYQAAVLSKLCNHVYSIEIVEPLANQARKRLAALGYANVTGRRSTSSSWPPRPTTFHRHSSNNSPLAGDW